MGDIIHPIASVRVLTNADLLHGIFTFIPCASDTQDSYLAQCTAVCHTFYEPAIRVLWRDLGTLLPLWHLLAPPNTPLPPDKAAEDELLHYLETINSAQLYLDPTRWDRFLQHAAYVRGIRHWTYTSPAAEGENRLLVQAVVMQNGGRTVLPLLRSIRWHACDPPRNGALIPFFTSTLRHASFTTRSEEGPSGHLLRRLRESSPVLESLHLNYLSPSLVQELLRFDRLEKVAVYRISRPEHFQGIITKPNLTELRVKDVVGLWPDPGRTVSVRDLRLLVVTGTAPGLSSLFTYARFHALESASVHLSGLHENHFSSADIVALLGLFYTAVSASPVHTLNLSLFSTAQLPNDDFPALRDLLSATLPLRNLRSFTLAGLLDIMPVDDADIATLARAWSKLEHLTIGSGTTSTSGVSLGALHYLAGACPNLRELSLPGLIYPVVGVHAIPAPPLPPASASSPAHPLRKLQVRTRSVRKAVFVSISDETAEAVARYLLDLFPSLDGWKYMPAPAPPREPSPEPEPEPASPAGGRRFEFSSFMMGDDRWQKVVRHIYAICAAREEMEL